MKLWRPWLSEHDEAPKFRTKPRPLVEAACPTLTPAQVAEVALAFRDDLGRRYAREMERFYGESWTDALVAEVERCAFSVVRQWARERNLLETPHATPA